MFIKTLKVRVYPTKEQRDLFDNYFGYSRWCYNNFLELWNIMYSNGDKPNYRKVRNELKRIYKDLSSLDEYSWIKDYSSQVIDTSGEDVKRAWDNFFNPRMKNNKPKFKSKKRMNNSFRLNRKNKTDFQLLPNNRIHLTKVAPKRKGGLRYRDKQLVSKINDGSIQQVTISKKANRYFASIVVRYDNNFNPQNTNGNVCGIDLGIKDFAIFNNGITINDPSYHKLYTLEKRLAVYQRKLSKKSYASNNYKRLRTKIQKCYLDIYNIKHDFLQKLTTYIVRKYQYIGIEGLNVTNMLHNRKLSHKIYHSLFGTFREILKYKSKWYGNTLIEADTFYPSTQLCSQCGYRKVDDERLTLKDRTYICHNCGYIGDRDINAAKNLAKLADPSTNISPWN